MGLKTKQLILIFVGVIIMLTVQNLDSASKPVDHALLEKRAASPQFDNGKFNGGQRTLKLSLADYASMTCEFLFGDNDRTPSGKLPRKKVDLSAFEHSVGDHLSATWLGHSSVMINLDGYKILVDPVFQKRVSILGPTRFNGEVPLDIELVPPVDLIVISHNHYDHLNKYSIRRLKDRTQKFAVPLGVGSTLIGWGVEKEKIVELDWWEEYAYDERLTLAATPAQHFSGRSLGDRNETLWVSWCIMTPSKKVFFSGDSGYFDGFKRIGKTYGPFDLTFVECGAYDEMWRPVHMLPEETVQAHLDLQGKILHPIHWGTFNLALHAWYDPMQRLAAAAQASGVKTATPVVGETTVLGTHIPTARWWEDAREKIAQSKSIAARIESHGRRDETGVVGPSR